jgi:mannose-6-phosphate isomerase
MFIEADRTGIEAGPDGMSGLVAYPGPDPMASLLQDGGTRTTKSAGTSAVHSAKSNEIVEVQI